ncbi:MAG: hypothetical protein SWE60_13560 [Thermodesulfobacteriota bacterium]|nr:hypothetical protein [Thermodesulfobacteriota bacterium]
MKGKMSVPLFAIVVFGLLSLTPLSARAFDMTEYWPVRPGTVWMLDHEIFIVSAKTHQFAFFEGKQFVMASSFCHGMCGGGYAYLYAGPEGLLGVGLYEEGKMIDLSATPLKIAEKEMIIGQTVTSTIPAGVIDDEDPITLTVTLLAQESVTVPAGTFNDTLVLRLRIDDDPGSHYEEKLWLAKNVGPVKIERASEFPLNHEGCFFTCGSQDEETGQMVHRVISLDHVLGPQLVDVNDNGKLGLEEAVYILQVLSGSR